MRALATISAVILLGAGLASCDMPGSQQQAAAAPQAPCNCTTTPPGTMVPPPEPTEHLTRFSYAPRHHYVRHRYYGEARSASYHSRYGVYRERYAVTRSQQSVDAYDYVSSSRMSSYSQSGYEGSGAEGGYGRIVWVDGYGRGYFSNGPVTVAATMRGKRLAPYHGYDADCPDDGEPR